MRIPRAASLESVIAAVGVLVAAGGLGCGNADTPKLAAKEIGRDGDSESPTLVLERIRTVAVPRGMQIGGAQLLGDHDLLLWSSSSAKIWLHRGEGIDTLELPDSLLIVKAFLSVDGHLEVIDARSRSINEYDHGSKPVRRSRCSIPLLDIWTAKRSRDGSWSVAGFDSHGRPQLAISRRGACGSWSVVSFDSGAIGSPFTSESGTAVSYRDPKRGIDWLDSTGRRVKAVAPDSAELFRMGLSQHDSASTWVATEAVEIQNATLQVVADVKSDRRKLVLRDSLGRVLKTSEVQAMWSIVDHDTKSQRIVAAHKSDKLELLVYNWRWR